MLCFAHIPDLPDKNGEVCEKRIRGKLLYKLIHAAGAFQYFSCIQVKYKGAVNDFAIFQGFYIYTGDSLLHRRMRLVSASFLQAASTESSKRKKLSAQMGFN